MKSAVQQIFITSDPNIPYFLRVDWSGDLGAGFTLVLTNGCAAWIGEVSEEVTKAASDSGMSSEKYVEVLHQTLIHDGEERTLGEKSTCSFQLSSDQLTYLKMSDNVLVKLGSVELQPAPDPLELNQEMIRQTLKRHSHLQHSHSRLLEENCKLQQEHRHILQELNTCVEDKNCLEKQMHSRFVMILNEKKSKIRELQQAVGAVQGTSEQPVRTRRDSSNDDDSSSLDKKHFHDATILITGRNLVCHGIPVSQSSSSSEGRSQPEAQH